MALCNIRKDREFEVVTVQFQKCDYPNSCEYGGQSCRYMSTFALCSRTALRVEGVEEEEGKEGEGEEGEGEEGEGAEAEASS